MSYSSSIKVKFGKQLKVYRDYISLTQTEYAAYIGSDQSTIADIESGKHGISIDTMERIVESFGLEYYEFGNPAFKIPPLRKMPQALHDYLDKVKVDRLARKQEEGMKITVHLDPILDSDFLRTPKTARMIAERIQATAEVTIPPGRITAELTKAPRNARVKVVDKPEGEKASGHWYQLVEIG